MNPSPKNLEDAFVQGMFDTIKQKKSGLKKKLNIPFVDVKLLRCNMGLCQYDFAERYGIPIKTLQNWEQGVRKPDTFSNILLNLISNEPTEMAKKIENLLTCNQ